MRKTNGSAKAGASNAYRRLLSGKITSKQLHGSGEAQRQDRPLRSEARELAP
jgi:hypothetical protein